MEVISKESQERILETEQRRIRSSSVAMESDLEPPESPASSSSSEFERDRHEAFLQMMQQMLPHHYQSQEINRLTLAYFVLSGLHLLGSLHSVLSLSLSPLFGVWFPRNWPGKEELRFLKRNLIIIIIIILVEREKFCFVFVWAFINATKLVFLVSRFDLLAFLLFFDQFLLWELVVDRSL